MRGLKDVYLDTSKASFIDGTIGKLLYRGYSIHDLAEKSTFEEVVYLLLFGKLPNQKELDALDTQMRADRGLPPEVIEIIDKVKSAHPMDVLRTGISALSAFDPEIKDNSVDATIRKGLRLTAKAPTIVAAHHRIRSGQKPVEPNPELNHAGNFLAMLFGKPPADEESSIMDVDFILHAEHGANASAFAARVAASTISDLHSAVVSGIATLKGPAHGGAAEEVMKMAQDIGEPDEYFTKARFVQMRKFNYDEKLNFAFVDRVTGGSVPNNFIPAVEKGIRERMEQGVLAGYQVQDCVCELFFGKDHPVDSNETAFKTAASMCFRDVFQQAQPVLLEPIVQLEITVPDEKLGDITGDLNSRRGRMEGMDNVGGGFQVIKAKAFWSQMILVIFPHLGLCMYCLILKSIIHTMSFSFSIV